MESLMLNPQLKSKSLEKLNLHLVWDRCDECEGAIESVPNHLKEGVCLNCKKCFVLEAPSPRVSHIYTNEDNQTVELYVGQAART